MFKKPYRWLLMEALKNENLSISAQFADLDLLVDSEVLFAKRTSNDEYLILSSKY